MAATVFAQSPYQSIDEKNNSYLNTRQERVTKSNVRFADAPLLKANQPARENPTELDPSLFVQPEGELQLMRRSGTDYLPVWGNPAPADYTEKGTYVVKGNQVIIGTGKDQDTLTLSADGKKLSGTMDGKKFTLTRTK